MFTVSKWRQRLLHDEEAFPSVKPTQVVAQSTATAEHPGVPLEGSLARLCDGWEYDLIDVLEMFRLT